MSGVSRQRIGQILRELRDKAGLTQAQLASRLGRTTTSVSKIELGHRGIEMPEIARWAAACGFDARLEFSDRANADQIVEPMVTAEVFGDVADELRAVLPRLDAEGHALAGAFVRYLSRNA